jgi:hypothetical protein
MQLFYANMDWWDVAEQPTNCKEICEKFEALSNRWLASKTNQPKIIAELTPLLRSKFIIENIKNFKSIFDTKKLNGDLEVVAIKVVIVDLDFSSGPLPMCKSESFFKIPVKSSFKKIDIEEWQETNSRFYDAITFYWDFNFKFDLDCDLSFGSNSGVECIPIN